VVETSPHSITKSAPVAFPERCLASTSTGSATSSGCGNASGPRVTGCVSCDGVWTRTRWGGNGGESWIYDVKVMHRPSVGIGLREIVLGVLFALHRFWLSKVIILFGAAFWAPGESIT